MKGIAVAGTILVDVINEISSYPESGSLCKILSRAYYTGGMVPNVGIDLKRLDEKLDVFAIGNVGKDEYGEFAKTTLSENGLNTDGIKETGLPTGFTDVMSVKGGQRTFFTYTGAGDSFGFRDIDFDTLDVKMFHLGYFLLLDKVDRGDGVEILKKCKEKGIKTSIDVVTEDSGRYSLIKPCLSYVDNLIINEQEAGRICGVAPNENNLRLLAETLKKSGVKERVIIHTPRKSVCFSDGGYTEVCSYKLPEGYVKGTTGAGDAFCAGALLGIYNGLSDSDILETATVSATGSLSSADAVSGMKNLKVLKNFVKGLSRLC